MTHISNWMHPDVTAILEIAPKPVNKQNYVTEAFVSVQIMPLTSQNVDAILDLKVSSYVLLGVLRKLINTLMMQNYSLWWACKLTVGLCIERRR